MKKNILIIIIIYLLISTTGCTTTSKNLSNMEKSYFDIVNVVLNSGNITSNQAKNAIQNNLSYKQVDKLNIYTSEGDFYNLPPTTIFRFKYDDETLKLEYSKDTGEIEKIIYESADVANLRDINSSIYFKVNDYANKDFNLEIKSTFNDFDNAKKLNDLIINSQKLNSDLYKTYIYICMSLQNEKTISPQYIKKLMPNIEVTNYNNSHFEHISNKETLKFYGNSAYYSTENITISFSKNNNYITIKQDNLIKLKSLYRLIYGKSTEF